MKRFIQLLLLLSLFFFAQCESESDTPEDVLIENEQGSQDESSDDTDDEDVPNDDTEEDDDSEGSGDGDGDESGEDGSDGDGSDENEDEDEDEDNDNDGEGDEGGEDGSDGGNEEDGDNGETSGGCDNEDAVFDDTDEASETTSECAQLLNEGTVACLANGVPFVSSGPFSAGGFDEEEGAFVFGILAGDGIDDTVDINATDQRGIAVLLSAVDMGLDDVEENVEYRGTNGENLFSGGFEVLASYVRIENCETTEGGFDFSPTAVITFTEIDRDNQLISGTFSFMAFDEETGTTYPVQNGTFENLWYCDQSAIEGKSRIFDDTLRRLSRR